MSVAPALYTTIHKQFLKKGNLLPAGARVHVCRQLFGAYGSAIRRFAPFATDFDDSNNQPAYFDGLRWKCHGFLKNVILNDSLDNLQRLQTIITSQDAAKSPNHIVR